MPLNSGTHNVLKVTFYHNYFYTAILILLISL